MPNWCNNNIRIYGDEGTISTLTSVLKGLTSEDNVFQSLIGLPPYMSNGEYGEKWYDTNINWFGTKWDISTDITAFTFGKEEISFFCETAWSPPIPFLENLCKMYKVNAYLFYSEGGVGFAGETTFEWNRDDELDVFDDECGFLEGLYKYSDEEFWSEVEYQADCILDEDQSLDDFLEEFTFVSNKDKERLTIIYNETIKDKDEELEVE